MGTWSVSLTGNDTAQDLLSDYTCAFSFYGENAVEKIDEYVRENICDETDEEEWCNYVYSLADFMWKKGILTDEIKDRALHMIDSGFGMGIWNKAGQSTLKKRKKVLAELRDKLMSPMGPKKKIKPNVHAEQIFNDGDIVAIKLITKDKSVAGHAKYITDMTDEEFHSYDGKYILIQKINCYSSWQCAMVPEINDWWARFRLFDGIYDEIPEEIAVDQLKDASFVEANGASLFTCESSMSYFRKRKYKVICNHKESIEKYVNMNVSNSIYLGVSNEQWDPDSFFLAAIGCEKTIRKWEGTIDTLLEIAHYANQYGSYDYQLSKEENAQNRKNEEELIDEKLQNAMNDSETEFYMVHWGKDCAFATLKQGKIDNIYVAGNYHGKGIATYLVKELANLSGGKAHISIPDTRYKAILEKLSQNAQLNRNKQ